RIGVVMEKHQGLRPGMPRYLHALKPGGVPPAFSRRLELLGCKLRVVNEYVRTGSQFPQTLVHFRVAGLVVRGISNRTGRRLDSKAQAALRVIQPARRDFVFTNRKRIAA